MSKLSKLDRAKAFSFPRSSTGTASIECLLVVPFRSQRPAVGGVPGQLSRQNASLAFSVCQLRVVLSGPCPSPRARSSLLLWFVVLPLPLVKGKHSKPSKETP